MAYEIQIKRDITENWESVNPILAEGEFGFDVETKALKLGDGISHWIDLVNMNSYIILDDNNIPLPNKSNLKFEGATVSSTEKDTIVKVNDWVLNAPVIFNIASGKTLGKYVGGTPQTIGEAGWTIDQLIRDIALELLPPTAILTLNSNQPEYNSTDITNELIFRYTIKTSGTTIASGYPKIQTRRNNEGDWVNLTFQEDQQNGNYICTHENLNVVDKISSFDYQLIVRDSAGAETIKTVSVTPKTYVSPTTASLTETLKEIGDTYFSSTRTITKNSPNTTLTNWQLCYKLNSDTSYTEVGTATNFINQTSTDSISITVTNPNNGTDGTLNGTQITGLKSASRIKIYLKVTDSVQTNYLLVLDRSLEYKKFYGSTETVPDNSGVRALIKTDYDTTNFNWNASNLKHTIALPLGKTLTSVISSSSENLTSNFVLSTGNVKDAGGNNVTYNIYSYSTAVPFNVTLNIITT